VQVVSARGERMRKGAAYQFERCAITDVDGLNRLAGEGGAGPWDGGVIASASQERSGGARRPQSVELRLALPPGLAPDTGRVEGSGRRSAETIGLRNAGTTAA
jgi:hypothetical protein